MLPFLDDVELYGLWRGFRTLAKKEGPDADLLLSRPEALEGSGFHVRRNPRSGSVYVARDEATLSEVIALEDSELQGGDPVARIHAVERIGQLLGYPDCCARAFAELPRQDDDYVVERLLADDPPAPLPWLLDFLPPLAGPVVHFPCRLDCAASHDLASRLAEAWDRDRPGTLARLRDDLAGPVLAAGRLDFLVLDGALESPGVASYRGFRGAGEYRPGMAPTPAFAFFRSELPPEGTLEIEGPLVRARDVSGALRAMFRSPGVRPRLLDYR